METYERIKRLRLKNSLTQKELAETLRVSTVSVQCWENGSKSPSMSAVIALARKFNVTTDYLLGVSENQSFDSFLLAGDEERLLNDYRALDTYGKKAVECICRLEKTRINSTISAKSNKTIPFPEDATAPKRYIPRYSTPSAAGNSVPLDGEDFEMILADDSVPRDADFAVGIQGNSMLPYIHDGDTVYVKRDCELKVGDVGIFCVDGAMYCKQYYIDADRNLTLVSANPRLKHTNIHVPFDGGSSVKCYGKVLLDIKTPLPNYML